MYSAAIRHLVIILLLACCPVTLAGPPFTYSAARHEAGELKFVNDVPILVVSGSPEEIGEQIGVLVLRHAQQLMQFPDDMLHKRNLQHLRPLLIQAGKTMFPQFPEHHRRELEAMAHWGQVSKDQLKFINTIDDLERIGGCSSITLLGERSTTGCPLMARNLDYNAPDYVPYYSLVTVYLAKDKLRFASIGFPGLLGVMSGINEAGLVLATHDIKKTADGSPSFSADGMPMTLSFRRVMEECRTVAEAEELMRSVKRTTYLSIAVCDPQDAAVLELTPQSVVVRRPENGLLVSTNHFRSPELRVPRKKNCRRYASLVRDGVTSQHDVPMLWKRLHRASRRGTLQSMVFEPASLKLHLSFGAIPATSQAAKTIELPATLQAPKTIELIDLIRSNSEKARKG